MAKAGGWVVVAGTGAGASGTLAREKGSFGWRVS